MDVIVQRVWWIRCIGCLVAFVPLASAGAFGQQAPAPTFVEPASFFPPDVNGPAAAAVNPGVVQPLFADYDTDLLDEGPPKSGLTFTFTPRFMVGRVAGYTQVAKADAAHTTSHHRPRLGELGIGDALIPDLELAISHGPHEVYAGLQVIRLAGVQTLRQRLTSDGTTFAKGGRIRSLENLDWYRLGYRYSIPMLQGNDGIPRLMLTPAVELAWWTFEYRLKHSLGTNSSTGASLGIQTARRSFDRFTGRGGAALEWRPYGGPFSLEGKVMADPLAAGIPYIATEELTARYRLIDTSRYGLTVETGVVFEQMDYNDRNAFANHVHADFGPLFVVGVNARF